MKTLSQSRKARRARSGYRWIPGNGNDAGVSAQQAAQFTDGLIKVASRINGLPADFARNHDHYIHGLPKK